MGSCFSSDTTKVTGSSSTGSRSTATAAAAARKQQQQVELKPQGNAASSPPDKDSYKHGHRRRPSGGAGPCGKRTDFGYAKDFGSRYSIGKELGHGQFGYTYVATEKATGERVAVKRIDKKKMMLPIAIEDVKREVKILQALKGHENIVDFYNVAI